MSTQAILRDALSTSETVAAIDHVLQLGYSLERARRACQPYLDSVTSAYGLLSRDDQEATAQAAADAAIERRLDCDARPLAWTYLQIECARQIAEENVERASPNEFALEAATATLELLEFATTRARARWENSDEIREYAFGGESLAGSSERGHHHTPSEVEGELQAWTEGGDWENEGGFWVSDYASAIDPATDREIDENTVNVHVRFEPDAPACKKGREHDWQSPYAVLGGLQENPGVWGKGGGVLCREVCAYCGTYRVTDTWAQDPSTGIQGLTSVSYEDADDDALAWVRADEEDDEDDEDDDAREGIAAQ
jgi:hypothetical protein